MVVPEPFAHGGTRFDGVKLNAFGGEFVSHAGERVRTLHVHTRCGGKIENYQLRRRRLATNTAQDHIANIVNVEVDQERFRPENHHVRNQFVVCMAVAVRETARTGNPSEKSDVRMRRYAYQLHE